VEEKLRRLRDDPALFAELLCGFKPHPYQAKLLRDRSNRIVACWGRQTGKSTTTALKAIHYAFTHPNATILIVSPTERQSLLMFRKIKRFLHAEVRGARLLEASIVRETEKLIELSNGSVIIPLPATEETIRGYSADMVIIDEAAFVKDSLIKSVVMPMLAATDGTLIMLSTPWSKQHIFYKAFTDVSGEWSVHHVPSTECPHISPKFLERQRRLMSETEFRREYLAEFVEEEACYFPTDLIESCVEPELQAARLVDYLPPVEGPLYAGLDLGKLRDYSVLAAVEAQGDVLKLRLLRVFKLNTPYEEVIGEVMRLNELHSIEKLAMDRSGVGERPYEELQEKLGVVEGVKFTQRMKAQLFTNLKMLMERGRLKLPHDRILFSHLNAVECHTTASGGLRFTHPEGTHDDAAVALALACWAASRPSGRAVKLWGGET